MLDPEKPRKCDEVYPNGDRKPFKTTLDQALAFASAAAKAFGVGEGRTVPFDKERAVRDVKGENGAKPKSKKAK